MEAYIYYALLILLQVFFIIQLYYLVVIQQKLGADTIINSEEGYKLAVSVIICARNEAANLKKNLPYIFNQKDIDFEVVVVNDCSIDDSEEVLRVFGEQNARLKIVKKEEHPRFKTGKKFAATLGVKAATNEVLVFTDADCRPDSEVWLAQMCSHYRNEQTEIVLGYSPYEKLKGFLNLMIRYETFQTAINYFSFALHGLPYMGVGRNLSYKKSLFFKGKGFAAHMHIPSGDDDLFVNQNATAYNTAIEVRPEAHTWSEPKMSLKSYWHQKTRHMGAGKMYKSSHKQLLGIQALSAIGFYVLMVCCLVLKIEVIFISILFVLRLLIQIYIFRKSMIKLRCKDLAPWIIILDPVYYLFLSALSFRSLFRKKILWK